MAVTRAGGFGVLGASTSTPEQFATELDWLDEHTDGRPYGVDVLIPVGYDARAEATPGELEALIPAEHRAFQDRILPSTACPSCPTTSATGCAATSPPAAAP